jgi:hypothetical protein
MKTQSLAEKMKGVQSEGKIPSSLTSSPMVLRFQIWDPSEEAVQPTVAATRVQSERGNL